MKYEFALKNHSKISFTNFENETQNNNYSANYNYYIKRGKFLYNILKQTLM